MRVNLKLFHKTLFLVALPLAIEVLFTLSLYGQLQQVEAGAQREHRAREAVASLNSLYERIVEISRLLGAYVVLKQSGPTIEMSHQLMAPIPEDIANLREQLQSDGAAMNEVNKLDKEITTAVRIVNDTFSLMENGDRISGLQRLKELKNSIPNLSEQLNNLRGKCNRVADDSFDDQRRARRHLGLYLQCGIIFNLVMATVLTIMINRGITNRLLVLIENTKRLAKGQQLLPPVGGTDEISHLDKVFKEMAVGLEMAHKKERAIIDTMPAGLVITDAGGAIQIVNPMTVQLLGCERDDLSGQPIGKLFAVDVSLSAGALFADIANKAMNRIDERFVVRSDGSMFPVQISATSFNVFEDKYFLFVMLDITERKEIEKLKQEFVSMVSHDLRTPITSIQVFLDMLGQGMFGQISDALQVKASMADRNATRLIGLINDLLDIDKMESGQLNLACEPVLISSIVERSLESVRAIAEKKQIALRAADCGGISLNADGDRLVQVMVNLLGNSVKFSPQGSTITIAVEETGQSVTVKVVDQGRGIPKELVESIFERFKQVEAKDGTEKKGTGLGLAICKAIIEQHGGTLGVHSEEGTGSTFWFRLPAMVTVLNNKETSTVGDNSVLSS